MKSNSYYIALLVLWLLYVYFSVVYGVLQARSQFKTRSTANNVVILVPVPSDADSPKFKTSTGSAKWVPEKSAVEWTIKSFPVSDTFTSLAILSCSVLSNVCIVRPGHDLKKTLFNIYNDHSLFTLILSCYSKQNDWNIISGMYSKRTFKNFFARKPFFFFFLS